MGAGKKEEKNGDRSCGADGPHAVRWKKVARAGALTQNLRMDPTSKMHA